VDTCYVLIHALFVLLSLIQKCIYIYITTGNMVTQWLSCCATNQKVIVLIPAGVIGFFIDIKSFRSNYGSNRNEYQEHFLRVKAAGTYG